MSKYNAQPVEIDGIRFASKAEGRRYHDLKLLEKCGKITGLELQPRFVLLPPFKSNDGRAVRGITYVGDFKYTDAGTGATIIEDVKGVETPVFKLKEKLMLSQGINLVKVKP